MNNGISRVAATSVAVACICTPAVSAQESDGSDIEELTVTGRFISSSQRLVNERLDDAFATDLLGDETITRLGDATVAAALRRVPGLTLVQDKFVYIRGLGERYSQSTLNGAQVPSPDLTRNVIPLNIFPTSIVDSLRVQKSWSSDLSANFGGGAVDIRTKAIPDGLSVSFEAGIAGSTANPGNVYTYAGGDDDWLGTDDGSRDLSPAIYNGLVQTQGNPSVNSILGFQQRQDPTSTQYDAESANRDFALELNRDIGVRKRSAEPDYKIRGSVGNSYEVGTDWELGFSAGGSYETGWRSRETRTAFYGDPEEQNGFREEATRNINIAGTLNLGAKWLADHEISTTSLFLRNSDDETEVFDFFNENRLKSSGRGFRDYRLQWEERDLITNQIRGTHFLGDDTRAVLPFLDTLLSWVPVETSVGWYYSDSTADTDLPNQVEVASETFTNRDTGAVESESVRLTSAAADYRFTDLKDEVKDYGWSFAIPIDFSSSYVELSGGSSHSQKSRTYNQTQFSLGYLVVDESSVLQGELNEVFSDENITADVADPTNPVPGSREFINDAVFDRQGTNTNSYLAATMTDSVWGSVDYTWRDTWRLAVGARWEDYRQVAVDWNPWGFAPDDPQVTVDPVALEQSTFDEDEIYPSVGITYMGDLWAETFQLRLGYSQTSIRPDLREITDSSYIDPITGELVRGNPGVEPADFDNIDLRAEWFWSNGNSLSTTLYYKDIDDPIEFFEIPASDTTIAREIINAESGEVKGIEIEGLMELAFLGGIFDTLFVQGNVTFQDTELVAGPNANVPTNPVRSLSGASDYVINLMLGFDSRDAKHTASLIYNVFDERLYVAGRNGAPDGFEQPFHSLDATYFWYPSERITLKAKVQNILDEKIEIERADVTTFSEEPGIIYGLSLSWAL